MFKLRGDWPSSLASGWAAGADKVAPQWGTGTSDMSTDASSSFSAGGTQVLAWLSGCSHHQDILPTSIWWLNDSRGSELWLERSPYLTRSWIISIPSHQWARYRGGTESQRKRDTKNGRSCPVYTKMSYNSTGLLYTLSVDAENKRKMGIHSPCVSLTNLSSAGLNQREFYIEIWTEKRERDNNPHPAPTTPKNSYMNRRPALNN